jgi:hypothetical protein
MYMLCTVYVHVMYCVCTCYVLCMYVPCTVYVRTMYCVCTYHVLCMYMTCTVPCTVYVRTMYCVCTWHVLCMYVPFTLIVKSICIYFRFLDINSETDMHIFSIFGRMYHINSQFFVYAFAPSRVLFDVSLFSQRKDC